MASVLLNDAEKTFILHGVEVDLRCDGRRRGDYRPMELETDVVSTASGSARLRLANTDILVGVKTEIDVPYPENPEEGKLEFFVDCSANATPAFEGRGGEDLANEISSRLSRAYQSLPLAPLCIVPKQACWKLYVDILILECGGNFYDAISLAVKAALFNTRVPQVTGSFLDGGSVDLEVSDDPFQCWRLDITKAPVLVTLSKIGDNCVVDPTAEEETCSVASIVVAVLDSGSLTAVIKIGEGSVHEQTLIETIKTAQKIGVELNSSLMTALNQEESLGPKRQRFGFLK
ncbi:unnamed protein product [Bemisia tabaci]|uniref:Ribosomal RNA-processing protein 42 n=1 Tax=Bemisia tabaci TaxID=7038 RepID=A0A9P0EZ11_BEMTA|nr:PREDICTED: exosome complex component RRP42 [Bemisia tabaci]XP_018917184.1 PREDICTED: exosome complex component RRP42 [Bemisia tabaci]CAH0385076.1 unnamed protein product [Bemisia tabaci]